MDRVREEGRKEREREKNRKKKKEKKKNLEKCSLTHISEETKS